MQGQVTDIEIQTNEIKKTKLKLNEIYSKHTGKKLSEISSIMERDKYFSADEAIKFGLIDKVVFEPIPPQLTSFAINSVPLSVFARTKPDSTPIIVAVTRLFSPIN
mgnify:CR=1 FL=1